MPKILKNTTGSPIDLDVLGLPSIPSSSQTTIEIFNYNLLASDDSINYLTPLINNGDIVVNDGVNDLIVSGGISLLRAIDFLRYPDTAFNQRFLSDPERVNGFNSKNTQEAIEEARTGFEGKGFQVSFIGNGTVKNSWMQQEDQNIESNQTPNVFKFKARLIGVSLENQNQNSDATILLAIRDYPFSNLNNIDRSYKWTLNNVRFATKSNQTAGFIVNPGDVMAAYVKDDGQDLNDVVLTLDFIVLQASNQDMQFSASGNFNSNDFPSVGTIPEILE